MPSVNLSLYLAFILATCILMLIPGPNVALIVANSVAYGPAYLNAYRQLPDIESRLKTPRDN